MNTFVYVTLVILLYGSALAAIVYFAIKKTRLFMILLGIAALVGAIPLGFMAEISISGCCGAPSSGREGLGYLLGALVGIAGISLILFSRKIKKKTSQK